MADNSTTKTVLMLIARRGAVLIGGALVTHGVVAAGDPNLAGFTEVVAGALVVMAEFGIEWWRKTGMVMISAQLARAKGIPLPAESKATVPRLVSTPDGSPLPVVEVKSAAA